MSSGKILQRQQKGWKIPMSWKFRPILGGCFTNPPKGTPPSQGVHPFLHVSGGYEAAGGVVLLFSPWAYPLHVPRLQFLIQLQRTFAPSKVEVCLFARDILNITKSSSTNNSDCFYYLLISCFLFGGRVLFLFFVRYRFLPRMCQFILGRF